MFEEEIEYVEKNEEDPENEIEPEDEERLNLLTHSLASAVLSLFVSIMNKQQPLKYRSFLTNLIKSSTFLMEVDGFKRSYRK